MAVEVVEQNSADAGDGGRRRLVDRAVGARAAAALSGEVGADLLHRLVDLVCASAEPDGRLTAREWVEATVTASALLSYCEALRLTCVRETDRAIDPAGEGNRPAMGPEPSAAQGRGRAGSATAGRRAADELAPALGMPPRTASGLVSLARRVQDDLPAAADALADGRMTLTQVRVLEQVTRTMPVALTAAVEAIAVRHAGRTTSAQLRVRLEDEAARLNPAYTAEAAAEGVDQRDVRLGPSPLPGCRRLQLDLPALHAAGAWNALNGAAVSAQRRDCPDGGVEQRSLPQLRADLATALMTGQTPLALGLVDAPIPAAAALTRFAEVHVVVSAETLSGGGPGPERALPGRIPGIGPVDAVTVRQVAGTASWRRLVADPLTGVLAHRSPHTLAADGGDTDDRLDALRAEPMTSVEDLSTDSYRPGNRLRRHVIARDATCVWPACQHPASGSQFDHTLEWARTAPTGDVATAVRVGTTSADNGGSLCQRGHNAKTHCGWHLVQPSPGAFVWTSVTGRRYDVEASPLIPGYPPRRGPGETGGPGREPP